MNEEKGLNQHSYNHSDFFQNSNQSINEVEEEGPYFGDLEKED